MGEIHFDNRSSITTLEAAESTRGKVRAAWVRVGDIGFLEHEWRCSACNESWAVKGIMTPQGLGYDECPNCHAQMVEVVQ